MLVVCWEGRLDEGLFFTSIGVLLIIFPWLELLFVGWMVCMFGLAFGFNDWPVLVVTFWVALVGVGWLIRVVLWLKGGRKGVWLGFTPDGGIADPMNWNPVAEAAPNCLVDVSTGVTKFVLGWKELVDGVLLSGSWAGFLPCVRFCWVCCGVGFGVDAWASVKAAGMASWMLRPPITRRSNSSVYFLSKISWFNCTRCCHDGRKWDFG